MDFIKFDFTEAEAELNEWYSPKDISEQLKTAALLVVCADADTLDASACNLCKAVLNACDVLDKIKPSTDNKPLGE